jgi:hypothetical protein
MLRHQGSFFLKNIKSEALNTGKESNYRNYKKRDTFGYTHGTVSTTFIDISASGTDSGIIGDDVEGNVSMPFEFDLYGTVSRDLRVSTNGAILFDDTSGTIAFTNETFPNAANPLMIAPYWDDMRGFNGFSDIYYATQGAAPNRSFIIQWDNWFSIDGFASGDFQVVFV